MAWSIAEMTDEETDEQADKEVRKIIIKLFRDNEEPWEELKESKNHIITKTKLFQNEILNLQTKVETLTNRMNTAEDRISETEDSQNENTEHQTPGEKLEQTQQDHKGNERQHEKSQISE